MGEDPHTADSGDPLRGGGTTVTAERTAPEPAGGATAVEAALPLAAVPERRGRPVWAAVGLAVVLVSGGAGIALGVRPPVGRILPGVQVRGVALGGMAPEAAQRALEERLQPALERSVSLVDGDRSWQTTPRALGCALDLESTVQAAHAVGRRGSVLRQTLEAWSVRRHGVDLKPRRVVDRKVLARRLRRIARAARVPSRDATVRFTGRAFLTTPEVVGHALDTEETEKNIVRYFDPLSHRLVKLVSRPEEPAVREADARRVNARLASFTTRFNPGDANRTQNLRLAAKALDGTVVPARGVFSYNDVVGPRSTELGYRVAKIFLKGKILDGVGGGVCQVATTVYNAARDSRMPILERARHSRPVTYAPPGRDATVSFGGVDLKFRNATDAPILIQTRVLGGSLTVSLYGNRRFRKAAQQTMTERPHVFLCDFLLTKVGS